MAHITGVLISQTCTEAFFEFSSSLDLFNFSYSEAVDIGVFRVRWSGRSRIVIFALFHVQLFSVAHCHGQVPGCRKRRIKKNFEK
ncbi:hypothetical protein NPIL_575111 [Nephila pilipes]|uniref:Uncharacterized protein n=1 Tax=Nephila pilipes TaxID=299642 RepID=A0A8X6QRF5_NEPPI|nr:hypothetical protein NPIL_575111 [Nephila pilipes]